MVNVAVVFVVSIAAAEVIVGNYCCSCCFVAVIIAVTLSGAVKIVVGVA